MNTHDSLLPSYFTTSVLLRHLYMYILYLHGGSVLCCDTAHLFPNSYSVMSHG